MMDPFRPPINPAFVVGMGRLTLDVLVHRNEEPGHARSQAGGTCGNVLTNLSCLGWQAYPLTNLGDDDPGHRYVHDLQRFGVRCDLIRHVPDQQTPVIVHHLRYTPSGSETSSDPPTHEIQHFFSTRCPFCHQPLQYFEPVPLADVQQRLPLLPPAQVFFFDRDSAGSLWLARHYREQGALIVYEPNYAGHETQFEDALRLAHVLKFSRERLPHLAEQHPLQGPMLVIETLASQGLRYWDQRTDSKQWQTLPPFAVPVVRDAGGSGDWCTAGLLHRTAQKGYSGFATISSAELVEALRFGQALAGWNCAFEGARGGLYHVSRERWQADVLRLLAGEALDPLDGAGPSTQDQAGRFCPRCYGSGRITVDRVR